MVGDVDFAGALERASYITPGKHRAYNFMLFRLILKRDLNEMRRTKIRVFSGGKIEQTFGNPHQKQLIMKELYFFSTTPRCTFVELRIILRK